MSRTVGGWRSATAAAAARSPDGDPSVVSANLDDALNANCTATTCWASLTVPVTSQTINTAQMHSQQAAVTLQHAGFATTAWMRIERVC